MYFTSKLGVVSTFLSSRGSSVLPSGIKPAPKFKSFFSSGTKRLTRSSCDVILFLTVIRRVASSPGFRTGVVASFAVSDVLSYTYDFPVLGIKSSDLALTS